MSLPAAAGAAPRNAGKTDKTLVSWVTLSNTTQQGGSALTIQRGVAFDAIVFGEKQPGKWMAGSDYFARTQDQQDANAAEHADAGTLIQSPSSMRAAASPSIATAHRMPRTQPTTLNC